MVKNVLEQGNDVADFLMKEIGKEVIEEKRKELKTHKIEIKLVDFTTDKDEPAYDIEVNIDGKSMSGGTYKGVVSVPRSGGKAKALKIAEARVKEILDNIAKLAKE